MTVQTVAPPMSGWCAAGFHRACTGTLDTVPEQCECQGCYHDPMNREDVHGFFGLTYANYLVLHRTLLQSMPEDWQRDFVTLLEQLRAAYIHLGENIDTDFQVSARGDGGKFIRDPIPHYQRGRTRVEPEAGRADRAGVLRRR